MKNLRGLVISCCPHINKVSAAVLLQRHWTTGSLPIVALWGLHDCPDSQMDKFENDGLFPVDIGFNNYRSTGHLSAPESVAKELDFFQDLTSGELQLVRTIEDNTAKGTLKQWPLSFAWLIRFAYHLSRFGGKERQIGLIESLRLTINTAVDGFDAKSSGDEIRDPRQFASAFPEESSSVEKYQYHPFTIGRYLRDLWMLGFPTDFIHEKAEFWLSVNADVENEMQSARRTLAQDPSPRFRTSNGLDGVVLETPNFFMTYAASGNGTDIVVAKNPETGHGAVKTKRKNISALAGELARQEQDRWHNDFRTGHLINGGPMYPDTPSTDLSAGELARLVEQYPPQ